MAEATEGITHRGMHRPATWCVNVSRAVLVIITAIGVMAADMAALTAMDIPTVTVTATATK